MDREARDDEIEGPERRQRDVEVVLDDLDAGITGEPLPGAPEHLGREVDSDTFRFRVRSPHETERVAVARPEVEHTAWRRRSTSMSTANPSVRCGMSSRSRRYRCAHADLLHKLTGSAELAGAVTARSRSRVPRPARAVARSG